MYIQWNTVMTVLQAAFDSLKETGDEDDLEKEMMQDHISMIIGDAYKVAVKIKSSEAACILSEWKMLPSSGKTHSSSKSPPTVLLPAVRWIRSTAKS